MKKLDVSYTHYDSVARLILCNDKTNILDLEMMGQMSKAIENFRKNQDIKLITIEGSGKHFSLGASVEEHTKNLAATMIRTFHNLILSLSELHIPVLSKVSGYCLGGGMELALATHFIFADKSATFGQPEVNLGVFPPPASVLLPLKIGYSKAEEILLTGRYIDATEATTLGMVNHLFLNKDSLQLETNKWIEEHIVPKSPVALKYATRATRIFMNGMLKDHLPILESIYVNELMETKDANEGINSFLEKRKPAWQNS